VDGVGGFVEVFEGVNWRGEKRGGDEDEEGEEMRG
jgi:hypothetical protein